MFTLFELFDMVVMVAAVGYIFMEFFRHLKPVRHDYDPLLHSYQGFDWDAFKFAAIVTAPAIILHELGHKFMAIGFGLQATFHAAYFWLAIGVILRLMRTRFIFFVPAYVVHSAIASPAQSALIAFAGPGVNLLIWLGAWFAISNNMINKKYLPHAVLTKQINMFLFIFNMLPIGFFDGAKVLNGLLATFGI